MEIKNKLMFFTLIMTIIIQHVGYAAENELLSLNENIENLKSKKDPIPYIIAKAILITNSDDIKDFETFNTASQNVYGFAWTKEETKIRISNNESEYNNLKEDFLQSDYTAKSSIDFYSTKLQNANTKNYIYKIEKQDDSLMQKFRSRSFYVLLTAACIPLSFYITNPMVVIGAIPWTIGYFTLPQRLEKFSKQIETTLKSDAENKYNTNANINSLVLWENLEQPEKDFLIDQEKQASWRYKSFNNLILLTQLASLGLSMYGVNKILLYFKVGWYADARRYCVVQFGNPTKKFISDTVLLNLANIFKESSANIVIRTYDPIIKGK